MRSQALSIELLEDAIFSEMNATAGSHRSLDYIPGSALLGCAASQLYAEMTPATAFELFHTGMVRFGNAYPAFGERATWPVPLSWYHPKGKKPLIDGRLNTSSIHNFAVETATNLAFQPQQIRNGYVSADGRYAAPAKTLHMKTAIQPGTNRAAEALLFTYEAIPAGTRYLADICCDDGVDEAAWTAIIDSLIGERLLGRSRSAEFGRVSITPAASRQEPECRASESRTTIVIWALSDLELRDEQGVPCLWPSAEMLGLGPGHLVAATTHLRTRSYTPWNGARRSFDLPRQVIRAGSVLSFTVERALTPAALDSLSTGVGSGRENGMGRICVNPVLLEEEHPTFEAVQTSEEPLTDASPALTPAHPLLSWLQARHNTAQTGSDLQHRAEELGKELEELYRIARHLLGLEESDPVGPSRSQWWSVRAVAENDGSKLEHSLFDDDKGVCRHGKEGWGARLSGDHADFREWLLAVCRSEKNPGRSSELVVRLARLAAAANFGRGSGEA